METTANMDKYLTGLELKKNKPESQKTIILKIKELINYKNLEPGDKLPSERVLAERFSISRSSLRQAMQKLEFYGILKSIPQSGTIIAEFGIVAINGMIDNMLSFKEPTFKSLVETRILLELKTVMLAAKNRGQDDLDRMNSALVAYSTKVLSHEDAVQEDLLFHLSIARASKNDSLNSVLLLFTPSIIMNFQKYHVCDEDSSVKGIQEHKEIYDAIVAQDESLAYQKMDVHFKVLHQFVMQS